MGDFIASFSINLFVHIHSAKKEFLCASVVLLHERIAAQRLQRRGQVCGLRAIYFLGYLEFALVSGFRSGRVLSEIFIPQMIEGGGQALVARLYFFRYFHRLLVIQRSFVKVPLGIRLCAGLQSGIQFFRQAGSSFRAAHTSFQLVGFGSFSRGFQRGDMFLQSQLRVLVFILRIAVIGAHNLGA